MNNQEFEKEVWQSYKRSVDVLTEKEKEYGIRSDRLIQFHRVAKRRGVSPCEALLGMAAKHYDSIENMAKNPPMYPLEKWDEKVTDLRNYTFLLDALIRDMDIK